MQCFETILKITFLKVLQAFVCNCLYSEIFTQNPVQSTAFRICHHKIDYTSYLISIKLQLLWKGSEVCAPNVKHPINSPCRNKKGRETALLPRHFHLEFGQAKH